MKKGKTLLILLIALSVLVGGYFAVTRLIPDEDDVTEEKSIASEVDESTVTAIKIAFDDKEFLLQRSSQGVWSAEGFAPLLDQATVADMLADACLVKSSVSVEGGSDAYATYGLDDPALTIELETTDGGSVKYLVGIENPVTGEYYFAVDGKEEIHLVNKTFYTTFAHDVIYYAMGETLPDAAENNAEITSFNIETGDKAYDFVYYPEGNDEVYSFNEFWHYVSPAYGEMPLDSYTFSTYVAKLKDIKLAGAVAYLPTDEEIASYGLDEPSARVSYSYTAIDKTGKSGSCTLLVGDETEPSHVYVMLEGGDFIYKVGRSAVGRVTELTPETYINPLSLPIDKETISSVDIKYQGKTYTIDYAIEKSVNDKGNEVTDYIYTINGQELDEDAEYYYEVLINFVRATYADVINLEPEEFDDSKPIIEVVVHRNTDTFKTLKLKFYDYDGSFCIADFEGRRVLQFDKNSIHDWAESVPNILGKYYQ